MCVYKEIMEMIDSVCQENFSRKLEVFLRKETILSFILKKIDILDVGCGAAILDIYLTRHDHKVVAVDNSIAELKVAMEIATKYMVPVTFMLCDALKLNFSDESFDLVIWEEILEHLEEPLLALKEGFRVLRQKGEIILSVPNSASLRGRIFKQLGLKNYLFYPGHKQNFTQDSITKLVHSAGFSIISLTSDFIPFPKFPLTFCLNKRKILARRYPSFGHHLIIHAKKNE